jgi:hypothetical protein
MEKQTQPQPQPKFLPPYFKFIGGGIILLSLILIITNLVFGQYNIIRPLALWLVLVGIILYVMSKGKIEKEKLMKAQQQHQPGPRPPFPNYFKKIGIGIILFVLFGLIPITLYLKTYNPQSIENYKQLFGILFIDITCIGFLLYAGAKEKVEDELIVKVRLQSMALAFLFGVIWTIIQPVIHYILNNKFVNLQSQNVILFMLIIYVVLFNSFKKNM